MKAKTKEWHLTDEVSEKDRLAINAEDHHLAKKTTKKACLDAETTEKARLKTKVEW